MKILMISTSGLGMHGISKHIIAYHEKICKRNYEVDVIVATRIDPKIKEEFDRINYNLIYLENRKSNLLKYMSQLNQIVKNGNYDIIHVHGNSPTMMVELFVAKRHGIECRIAHNHNEKGSESSINKLLIPFFKRTYTVALACSKSAGEWLFGNENYTILPNAIDLESFKYDVTKRNMLRKEMQLSDSFVIGHVGAYNEQKNHVFLVDIIFNSIKTNPKLKVILIGDGPKREEIQEKIRTLNLQDNFIELGIISDVTDYLNAFDTFLFPSLFEGLPISMIEAQASGLNCVISDKITKEINMSEEGFFQLSLNDNLDKWSDAMFYQSRNERVERSETNRKIIASKGYDIESATSELLHIYEFGEVKK